MPTCPSCGASGILLRTKNCMTCGKTGCNNCLSAVGHTLRPPNTWDPWLSCSWNCFDAWASRLVAGGSHTQMWGSSVMFNGVALSPYAHDRVGRMIAEHQRKWALASAINYVNAERHEDAARVYESMGMHKEAGEVRRKGRRQVSTQVHVNVNDLIDQIRKAGISTDYSCPTCGGHIRISGETSLAKLTSCEFCGSVIQTTDLVEFLTKVVGYR